MGSYQQVIVGGMLLLVAFFFGRYVNQQPRQENATAAAAVNAENSSPLPLQASRTKKESVLANDAKALQRSLRDKILGERAKKTDSNSKLALSVLPPEANKSSLPAQKLTFKEIVKPDFSHLEAETTVNSDPLPKITRQPALARNQYAPDSLAVDRIKLPESKIAARLPDRNPVELKRPRFTINDRPKQDMITSRGVLSINRPNSQMVPVQQKRSQLTLQEKEFVSYTTVFGDTLHSLSNKFFGKPDYYLDIYLANRELLENPADVPTNTTIQIPVNRESSPQANSNED